MSEYGHVAVLMGGWSEERPISLISGQCAYEALCARDVEASAVDLQRETLPQLAEQGFDRCFLALHGVGGEDGEVQQALEEMGLPYSGSGPEASRVCMDKLETKKRWWRAGLPTPKGALADPDRLEEQCEELGLPLVVKPVDQGSSIGVIFAHQAEDVPPAVEEAQQHGSKDPAGAPGARHRIHGRDPGGGGAAGHPPVPAERIFRLPGQVRIGRHPVRHPLRPAGGNGARTGGTGVSRFRMHRGERIWPGGPDFG